MMKAYETKNSHEARNEAIDNGNERLAQLIWDAWEECERTDPIAEYDEQDIGDIIKWTRETNAPLADELEKAAAEAYGGMTTKNNNLTPFHTCNVRELQMMVGKAACAYCNLKDAENADFSDYRFKYESQYEVVAALRSEYEATARCIEMFVRESLTDVFRYIIAEAEEMMA